MTNLFIYFWTATIHDHNEYKISTERSRASIFPQQRKKKHSHPKNVNQEELKLENNDTYNTAREEFPKSSDENSTT